MKSGKLLRYASYASISWLAAMVIAGCSSLDHSAANSSVAEQREGRFSPHAASKPQPTIDLGTYTLPRDRILPESQEHLQRIFGRLLERNGLPQNSAVLVMLGCEVPSAATVAESRTIRICRGMLRLTETDDEVAFVLAHELSHILLRHASEERNIGNHLSGTALEVMTLGAAAAGVASGGLLLPAYGVFAASQISKPEVGRRLAGINRREEAEADLNAIDLMVKAGYNPTGAIGILESLSGIVDVPIEGVRGFFSGSGQANAPVNRSQVYWRDFIDGREVKSANDDLRGHPSVKKRIQNAQDRIAAYYTEAVKVPVTPLGTSRERDGYLDMLQTARRGGDPGPAAHEDRNLVMFRAWVALRQRRPEIALQLLGALPDDDAGIDRWAKMAVVAAAYLHDKDRARTYADKHFLSKEWQHTKNGPQLMVLSALASPQVAKDAALVACRPEYRYIYSPLDYITPRRCSGPESYSKGGISALRDALEKDWSWQY